MGCNIKRDKSELIRITKNKENEIRIDLKGRQGDGRGAYICDNEECLEKVIKNKKLQRVFKTNIDLKIYESIRGVIIGK
ncbi:MAG: YlxR family protein [Clostridia bacterium]|nr:YlxR family protein [Clostridia bacterium]